MNFKDEITDRERQVLVMICEQKAAKEIAYELGLSTRWIEGVKYCLFRKTESRSLVGLALYAIKHKIYELN